MAYGLYNPSLNYNKPKFWLAKPNKEIVARLKEIDTTAKLNVEFGKTHQLSFTIPYSKEKNNKSIINPNINKINAKYLIKMEFMDNTEWFVIENFSKEVQEADSIPATAYSLQYELNYKKIYEIEVTSFTPQQILENVLANSGWTIGIIDVLLASKARSFTFSNTSVLDSLYQIAESFNGILQFDTVNQTVSLYHEDTISQFSGLVLNDKNYVNSLSNQKNASDIVTRLYPIGSEGLTINSVNPTGASYIEDFSYFLYPFTRDETTKEKIKSSFYLSDNLAHALLDYEELVESKKDILATKSTEKVTLQTELTALKTTLAEYESSLDMINDLTDIMRANREYTSRLINIVLAETVELKSGDYFIQMRTTSGTASMTFDGDVYNLTTSWTNVRETYPTDKKVAFSTSGFSGNSIEFYVTRIPTSELALTDAELQTRYNFFIIKDQVASQQTLADLKNAEIAVVDAELQAIHSEISIPNNFTPQLIAERTRYEYEQYWIEDNHIDAKELYEDGKKQFKTINKPSTVMNVDILNFLIMTGEVRNWAKLKEGSKLRVKYSKLNIESESILTGINYDFESNSISLSISDTKDLMTDEERLVKMIYASNSSSNYLALKKFTYDDAAKRTNAVETLLNEAWDATVRRIVAGANESVEIGKRGIVIRNANYPNDLLVAQAGVIAISNDRGLSFKNAITTDGIITERLIGQIIISEKVWIEDENGIITLRGDLQEIKNSNGDVLIQLGQYDIGKFGLKVFGGGIEIVGGLPKEQIDPQFSIGIIGEAEAISIKQQIEAINTEKAKMDAEFNVLYANANLTDVPKENLNTAKTNINTGYDTRYTELIDAINTAIVDNEMTIAEKDAIATAFTNYRTAISLLAQRTEEATDIIQKYYSDGKDTQIRTDLRLTAPLPSSLKMDESGITAYQADEAKFARMDYRGLYVQGGAIDIRTDIATDRGVQFDANGIRGFNIAGAKTFEVTTDGEALFGGLVKGSDIMLGGFNNQDGTLLVLDENGEAILNFDAGNVGSSRMVIGELVSPSVLSVQQVAMTVFVNASTGDDLNSGSSIAPFKTIQAAINAIPKYLKSNVTIEVTTATYNETVIIAGFTGEGDLKINLNKCGINGRLALVNCSNIIDIRGQDFNNHAKIGTINGSDPISVVTCQYAVLQNLWAKANGRADYAIYVAASNVYTYHCVHERALESGMFTTIGGNLYAFSPRGTGNKYAAKATSVSKIHMESTRPDFTTSATSESTGGTVTESVGITTVASPGDTVGTVTPIEPVTVSQGKIVQTSSSCLSWGDEFGWRSGNTLVQGEYDNTGNHRGLMYFDASAIQSTLAGKTVKSVRLFMTRSNRGGVGGLGSLSFHLHNYTSQPAGMPALGTSLGTLGSYSWSESKWITLPNSVGDALKAGTAKGLAIYNSSGKPYVLMNPAVQLEINYEG